MAFKLNFTEVAAAHLKQLEDSADLAKRLKAVRKALAYLEADPRHQGLNTHKWSDSGGPSGEPVFEAYAQNHTPGAYRIFFYYPQGAKGVIGIIAITPHP